MTLTSMRPPSLPPPSYWADRPHGTRLRYIAGCRCVPCRAAHSRYICRLDRLQQLGRGNPLVEVGPLVAHLRALSAEGIGYKRVAAIAGVSKTGLAAVLRGSKRHVRQRTADRVLAVRATLETRAPHALIPAAFTWRLLRRLIRDGYPKVRIARGLGQRGAGLQMGRRRVTVANARKVQQLAAEWLADDGILARSA